MLKRLVAWSVRRRGLVMVVWGCIAVTALLSAPQLAIDAVPDVTNVQVQIFTTAPGLTPLEIERYLTYPIEAAMNGLPGIREIRSVSRTSVSVVTVVFKDGTSVWFARQLVSERLRNAEHDIPRAYGHPELAPVATGLGQIYEFYLRSKRLSLMELRTLLDWDIAYRLRSVPGVIEVNALGGEAKQYQVVLDPARLAAHQLDVLKVVEALERNNAALGAGYITRDGEAYVIRGDAQLKGLDDIANTVVTTDARGTPVLVGQLGNVQLGRALPFGAATAQRDGEVVTGTVMMLIGESSRRVVADVKAKLAEIARDLPAGVEVVPFYDRAEFISRVLDTVAINLAEALGLVVLVLLVLLATLRGSVLAALAIPLSMAIAVLGMVQLGVSGNLLSLGAIDFGLLVDGSIVLLEAALVDLDRLRPDTPQARVEVVSQAMQRTARPVAFSLAIILLVYVPLLALEGVEGRMFRPMAITVALALLGALAFTLTGFPALTAILLRPPRKIAVHGRLFSRLERGYARLVRWALAHTAPVLGLAAAVTVGALLLGRGLGAEFVPRLEEGELSLDVRRLPSVSLDEAVRLGQQVERALSSLPEVVQVVTRTGRAEVPTEPVGFDEADVRVKLKPKEEWTSAHDLDGLAEVVKRTIESRVPATLVAVSQPIEDRVNTLLAGARSDVVIKIYGDDLVQLKDFADEVMRAIRPLPGAADVRAQRILGLPHLEVIPDRARLARHGVSAADVLAVVQSARIGRLAGILFEGPRRFELRVLSPPATATPSGIGNLLVPGGGALIPLAQLADIRETEGPAVIHRDALRRRVLVEANVRGRDLVGFVEEARARVSQLRLPPGMRVEWSGQFANFSRARQRLALVVPVAMAIIFAVLFFMFGDVRLALAVFGGVPLAVVGGVLALLARGLPFSIPAAVGFIAVAGVAVLNGVVMASAIRELVAQGAGRSAFYEGPAEVLRAMTTTALVAAIGFLPMALSTRTGAEVQRPLATVVIGGIVSSTLLSFIVLPVLIERLALRGRARAGAVDAR